jgi:phage/plasmid-like protein (TIGR03299 family)
MAHEIGEMFWYGDRPWHHLGRQVIQPATLDEALSAGGLDWHVTLEPLRTARHGNAVPQRYAVVRTDLAGDDDRRVLGVVHPAFRPLQNREGAELFHCLFDLDERRYHTGGYLHNGEVVWLLARLPETITVGDDDAVETYALYSNSHDGTQAIDIRLTTVRVVCRNTLTEALHRDSAAAFRRAHREGPRVLQAQAESFFEAMRKRIAATQALYRWLHAARCGDDAFDRFLRTLLPDPRPPAGAIAGSAPWRGHATRIATLAGYRRAVTRIRSCGLEALALDPEAPTWWGAVNAVTGWVDHVQPLEGGRYAHAMFGSGDRLKRVALALATAAAA